MSLTEILNYKNKTHEEFRTILTDLFPKPRLKYNFVIKAEPQTKNYALVGIAFDYLLRFVLEREYGSDLKHQLVARKLIESLKDNRVGHKDNLEYEQLEKLLERNKRINKFLIEKFTKTEDVFQNYVSGKTDLDSELLRGCLFLAKLDFISRAGLYYLPSTDFKNENSEDILDLKNLIGICNLKLFKPEKGIIFNPTFGKGSLLVGGADADLIIDDLLIDIKVTKDMKITRQYYNQIIGYYLLSLIGNIDNANNREIKQVGFYFARYGRLISWDISKLGNENTFNKAIEILIKISNNNR